MTALDRRPWYRLHFSTWAVIAVTLALLILIVVPGGWAHFIVNWGPIHYEHGWPFVWLDRFVWPFGGPACDPNQCNDIRQSQGRLRWAREGDIFWIEPGNWPLSGQCFPQWKGLVMDLVVALAITAAIAFLWEQWRRRHFQYRLRSLFVFVFLVSVILAWWRTAAVQCMREEDMIAALDLSYFDADCSSAAPVWLCRLVGWNHLPYLVVGIRGPIEPGDPPSGQDPAFAAFTVSKGFRNLERVNMDVADDRTMVPLAALSADLEHLHGSAGLRKLDISGTQVTDAGLQYLKGLTQLQELDRSDTKVTDEGVKTLQQALPNCKIIWEPPTKDEQQSRAAPDQPGG